MVSPALGRSPPQHKFIPPRIQWTQVGESGGHRHRSNKPSSLRRLLGDDSILLPPGKSPVCLNHPARPSPVHPELSKSSPIRSKQPLIQEGEYVKPNAADTDSAASKGSKILIKLSCKKKKNKKPEDHSPDETDHNDNKKSNNNPAAEETKTWNLRPRKARTGNDSRQPDRIKYSELMNGNLNRSSGEKENKSEKRKRRISIALSKEEIEEDFLTMTGSKPPRRPTKRPRNLQKQLDLFFPGLGLYVAGV